MVLQYKSALRWNRRLGVQTIHDVRDITGLLEDLEVARSDPFMNESP